MNPDTRVIITGSQGFVGKNLYTFLSKKGWNVTACTLDVRSEGEELEKYFKALNSDRAVLIHLAGMSFVPDCVKNPSTAMDVNANGALNVASAFQRVTPNGAVIFSSTAQVYAAPTEEEARLDVNRFLPWSESRSVRPQNVYAETKYQAETLLSQLHDRTALPIVVLRLFNHVHKSQDPRFFLPSVHSQLVKLKEKAVLDDSVMLGNLDLWRDFGSLADLLLAFEAILLKVFDAHLGFDVFNICSGQPQVLRRLVELMSERLGVSGKIVVDPARVRVGEPKVIVGSCQKFSSLTGWKPSVKTEEDLVESFLKDI